MLSTSSGSHRTGAGASSSPELATPEAAGSVHMAELLRLVPFALCAFVLPAPTQSQVPGTSGPDSLVGCYRLLYADGKAVFRDAAFTTSLVRLDSVRTPDVARRSEERRV